MSAPTAEQLAARQRWIALLREGKYRKLTRRLASASGKRRCCLGVACDPVVTGLDLIVGTVEQKVGVDARPTAIQVIDGQVSFLPRRVQEELGLDGGDVYVTLQRRFKAYTAGEDVPVSALNDDGMTHREIADLLEAKLVTPYLDEADASAEVSA